MPPCHKCGQQWSDPNVEHLCGLDLGDDELARPEPAVSDIAGKGAKSENIQVLVRIRPFIGREKEQGFSEHAIQAYDNTIHVKTQEHNIRCQYDAVLHSELTQAQVYESVRECTQSVLEGFNSTLFAYGQTGSGKSHTMFGPEGDGSLFRAGRISERAGVIPRAIHEIFDTVREGKMQEAVIFSSFIQIYNEHIFDLLRDPEMNNPLVIHEDRQHGIYCEGLSEYQVRSTKECLSLLRMGEENRAIRSTHMNQGTCVQSGCDEGCVATKTKSGLEH
jgi:kinesin family protein 3/17